jgi:hypothetical protein
MLERVAVSCSCHERVQSRVRLRLRVRVLEKNQMDRRAILFPLPSSRPPP